MKQQRRLSLFRHRTILLLGSTLFVSLVAAEDVKPLADPKPSALYTGTSRPSNSLGKKDDFFLESNKEGTIKVLRKISESEWLPVGTLARPPDSAAQQPQQCQTGAFMIGIDANGRIICEDLKTTIAGEKRKCHGHGVIKDGFCSCDAAWTGPDCERRKPPKDPNALPDEDHDSSPSPQDCNDHDDMVYPGAPDAVDGKDNDCDGEVDEGY